MTYHDIKTSSLYKRRIQELQVTVTIIQLKGLISGVVKSDSTAQYYANNNDE